MCSVCWQSFYLGTEGKMSKRRAENLSDCGLELDLYLFEFMTGEAVKAFEYIQGYSESF